MNGDSDRPASGGASWTATPHTGAASAALVPVLNTWLNMSVEPAEDCAAALLEALSGAGFALVREASQRAAQRRHAVRAMQVEQAERAAEHARKWAHDCLTEERRLRDRCTFLYGAARAHGASVEELTGPTANADPAVANPHAPAETS